MAKENSFCVSKINVPFDEVDPVFNSQPTMDIQVVFQVTKVAFYSVCGLWIMYMRLGIVLPEITSA